MKKIATVLALTAFAATAFAQSPAPAAEKTTATKHSKPAHKAEVKNTAPVAPASK